MKVNSCARHKIQVNSVVRCPMGGTVKVRESDAMVCLRLDGSYYIFSYRRMALFNKHINYFIFHTCD